MEKIKTMELIRAIRDKQYEEIKNMNSDEIINYFRNKAGSLKIKESVRPK